MTQQRPFVRDLYWRLECERCYATQETPVREWVERLGIDMTTYVSWKTADADKLVTESSFTKILDARASAGYLRAQDERWLGAGLDPAGWYCRAVVRDPTLPFTLADQKALAEKRDTPGGAPALTSYAHYLTTYSTWSLPRLLDQLLQVITDWMLDQLGRGEVIACLERSPVQLQAFLRDPVGSFLAHLPVTVVQDLASQAGAAQGAPWADVVWLEYESLWSMLPHPLMRMGVIAPEQLDRLRADLDLMYAQVRFAGSILDKLPTRTGPHFAWMVLTLADNLRLRLDSGGSSPAGLLPWHQAQQLLAKMTDIKREIDTLYQRTHSLHAAVARAIAALGPEVFGVKTLRAHLKRGSFPGDAEGTDAEIQKVLDRFCLAAEKGPAVGTDWDWRLERVPGGYRWLGAPNGL